MGEGKKVVLGRTGTVTCIGVCNILTALRGLYTISSRTGRVLTRLGSPISLYFRITKKPYNAFRFSGDNYGFARNSRNYAYGVGFGSPRGFGSLVSGDGPNVPAGNIIRILSFLVNPFAGLAGELAGLLVPAGRSLRGETFFRRSAVLAFCAVTNTVSTLTGSSSVSGFATTSAISNIVSVNVGSAYCTAMGIGGRRFAAVGRGTGGPETIVRFTSVSLTCNLFGNAISAVTRLYRNGVCVTNVVSVMSGLGHVLSEITICLNWIH